LLFSIVGLGGNLEHRGVLINFFVKKKWGDGGFVRKGFRSRFNMAT